MENKAASKNLNVNNKRPADFVLFVSVIVLLCIGLVMVSSASSYYALSNYGSTNFFLNKQLFFAVLGVIAMIIISNIDYHKYKKIAFIGFIVVALLMIAVLIPGIGVNVNGARRWIEVGGQRIQPSELMKVVLAIVLATYFANTYKKNEGIKGLIVPGIITAIVVGLMALQRHMSGAMVMCAIAAAVIWASGIKIKARYYIIVGVLLVAVVVGFIFSEGEDGYRLTRMLTFLNPEQANVKDDAWQITQSLYAIGSGGVFGRGLGQSRQKYLWLPEPQNDFIFAIIGEELGLVGCLVIVGLFAVFIIRGFSIALKCKDLYGTLLTVRHNGVVCFSGSGKYSSCYIINASNRYAITVL